MSTSKQSAGTPATATSGAVATSQPGIRQLCAAPSTGAQLHQAELGACAPSIGFEGNELANRLFDLVAILAAQEQLLDNVPGSLPEVGSSRSACPSVFDAVRLASMVRRDLYALASALPDCEVSTRHERIASDLRAFLGSPESGVQTSVQGAAEGAA